MLNFKLRIVLSACIHLRADLSMVSTGRPSHGLTGYGISMCKPRCAFACRDVLSSSMLACSESMDVSGMEMHMSSDTLPECYATDDPFLKTLAYCMSTHCQDVAIWALEKYWNMNVAGTLPNQPILKATYQQTFSDMGTDPTDTLVINEELDKTMFVSQEDYEGSYNAQGVFEEMEGNHERYGCVPAFALRLVD